MLKLFRSKRKGTKEKEGSGESMARPLSGSVKKYKSSLLGSITENLLALWLTDPSPEGRESKGGEVRKVRDILSATHPGKFLLFDCYCTCPAKKWYTNDVFDNMVLDVDISLCGAQGVAPSLEGLLNVCCSIDSWLRADQCNVAVIHAIPGHLYTGVIVACYLQFSGVCNASEGFELYRDRYKSKNKSKICMTASVKRILLGFSSVLDSFRSPVASSPTQTYLSSLVLRACPSIEANGCRPYLLILSNGKVVFSSAIKERGVRRAEGGSRIEFEVGIPLAGEVLIKCYHLPAMQSGQPMFSFQLHSSQATATMHFSKDVLDRLHEPQLYDEDFCVDVEFYAKPLEVVSDHASISTAGQRSPEYADEHDIESIHEYFESSTQMEEAKDNGVKGAEMCDEALARELQTQLALESELMNRFGETSPQLLADQVLARELQNELNSESSQVARELTENDAALAAYLQSELEAEARQEEEEVRNRERRAATRIIRARRQSSRTGGMPSDISSLPSYTFKSPVKHRTAEDTHTSPSTSKTTTCEAEDKKCMVCQYSFDDGDTLRVLPCIHSYHVECIDRWLQINMTCPVCQFRVDSIPDSHRSRSRPSRV
eukprot:GILK01007502.1.p1 GENE.GILK01007502.1~~GILK01007502.1.p1  ORF type:complete len:603 (-),score=104.42 GILK01007502.1:104-1912(-)